jgi:iron-sulfur cluster repair protein YtfE (RIC family)
VKTREKLFTELKAELELHTSLEEQHLFPILRNAETKELVADAIKDNKELRAKLAELESCRRRTRPSPNGSRNCRRPSASMPGTRNGSCYRRCSGR